MSQYFTDEELEGQFLMTEEELGYTPENIEALKNKVREANIINDKDHWISTLETILKENVYSPDKIYAVMSPFANYLIDNNLSRPKACDDIIAGILLDFMNMKGLNIKILNPTQENKKKVGEIFPKIKIVADLMNKNYGSDWSTIDVLHLVMDIIGNKSTKKDKEGHLDINYEEIHKFLKNKTPVDVKQIILETSKKPHSSS
jgi:hypothetical protein